MQLIFFTTDSPKLFSSLKTVCFAPRIFQLRFLQFTRSPVSKELHAFQNTNYIQSNNNLPDEYYYSYL